MQPTLEPADRAADARAAFVDRILQGVAGVFEVFSIYLGDRLGYYQALKDGSALTSSDLAKKTGTDERHAREWLEQQTTVGVLEVDEPGAEARARRFRLPPAHATALTDEESLDHVAPLVRLQVANVLPMDHLVHAYRTGGGLPPDVASFDALLAQGAVNRPAFLRLLGSEWLPNVPDLHARLEADPPARVADIGCGAAWSSIAMAKSYPKTRIDGFDLNEWAVALARRNVEEAGLADRVRVRVQDASDPALSGQYDLVTAFECLHDMARPVEALRVMRDLAGDHGTVLVVDERVGESFLSDDGDMDWLMYGWSVFSCLPGAMATPGAAGTGTVLRPSKLREYAEAAGFDRVEVLPIENYMFRFYRLHAGANRSGG